MWYIITGILSGILGAMGMGGGTILIPMLITFFGTKQKFAQFINLIAFIFMAIFAVILHKKNNLIDFTFGTIFAVFGAIFAFIASIVASKLNGKTLKTIFGVFLIVIGIFQLKTTIKKHKQEGNK